MRLAWRLSAVLLAGLAFSALASVAGTASAEDLDFLSMAATEGHSGVRRIRIRDFRVISDSPPDFAGYSLGPPSPELLLGAISGCRV